MGLLQVALQTYESMKDIVGIPIEGQQTLTPISHTVVNAQLEIAISQDGTFVEAGVIPKIEGKTIIPVTEESANRTGDNEVAHPLSDQLRYLAPYGEGKHSAYLKLLTEWMTSSFSHPKVVAVHTYIQGNTILGDLCSAGLLDLDENGEIKATKVPGTGTDINKCMVRWRVVPSPDGVSSACWEDVELFNAYAAFLNMRQGDKEQTLCMVSGKMMPSATFHPKGVVAKNNGAKLISANDSSGFTYRGRFTASDQACVVGYDTTQKAHNALRWLVANQGVIMGGRTFLWWQPQGKRMPDLSFLTRGRVAEKESSTQPDSNRMKLLHTLGGYRLEFTPADNAVVASLDAATTGRLSVTYFNELKALDLLERLQFWYETCCWDTWLWGEWSPSIKNIVECAWGSQRGSFIEVDEKILGKFSQQILHCVIEHRPIPESVVRALVSRANQPLAYTFHNRELILATTCAVVRKYHNDKQKKEVWTLALNEENHDRSYLFGRLLAIAEKVERSTYSREEKREPNAIRMQMAFSQQPLSKWRTIEERIEPYYKRLSPGLRQYFRGLTQEVVDRLDSDDPNLNKKLSDAYLLGYYQQRSALNKKKEDSAMEGTENVPTEE